MSVPEAVFAYRVYRECRENNSIFDLALKHGKVRQAKWCRRDMCWNWAEQQPPVS